MASITQEPRSVPMTPDARCATARMPRSAGAGSSRRKPMNRTDPVRIVPLRESAPIERIAGADRILACRHHPEAGRPPGALQARTGAYAAPRERVRS